MKSIKVFLGLTRLSLKELQDKYIPYYIRQPKPLKKNKALPIGLYRHIEKIS